MNHVNPVEQRCSYALSLIQKRFQDVLNALLVDSSDALRSHINKHQSLFNNPEVNYGSRLALAFSYFEPKFAQIFRWILQSDETSNFTYGLAESNTEYLISFCSAVLRMERSRIRSYIREIVHDEHLRQIMINSRAVLAARGMPLDEGFEFGRRLGWYVMARALKPRVIVETGVAQGMGSLVLTSALRRNHEEGVPGFYYGTDLDPEAGYLLCEPYSGYGSILYGDSISSLKNFPHMIDLFINDSDHSASYEYDEYLTVRQLLSPEAIILGDNAHVSDALCRFATETERDFLYFQERPANHWYPGAGIGVAFFRR